MKRSQRIQSIVDIKAQQASKALAAIGEQQHKLQAAKQQLALLQKYRQDHMQENVGNSAKRVNAFLAFRAFITKLDQDISCQEEMIETVKLELANKRQHWESLHRHTQSMQKVCDGWFATELQVAEKREQREADDRVAQRYLNQVTRA